jgi:hypothetical protein
VLVVTPGDDFILAERENRPDADLFADDIAILDLDIKDFGRGRCIQASKRGDLVTDDQEQLHPQRMMGENAEEDIDDAELPAAQRRPEGVTEIRAFDELAAQHAAGRHIAFNDVHAELRTWLVRAIAAVGHHMGYLKEAPPLQLLQAGADIGARHRKDVGAPRGSARAPRVQQGADLR